MDSRQAILPDALRVNANLSGTVNAGQATVLSLPGIPAFDERATAGKPVIIPLFNHRNVGHKKHARPTAIQGCYLQVY